MKTRNIVIAIAATTALLLQDTAAYANPTEPVPAVPASTQSIQPVYEFNEAVETPEVETDALTLETYRGLTVLENIPDEIIARGDDATTAYLQEAFGTSNPGEMRVFGIVGCISAIGMAIFAIVGPISKIKAAVKAAGGAWKLAKILNKAYNAARKAGFSRGDAIKWAKNEGVKSITRVDYKNLLLSLFGVGAVIGECFE